jgi:hypothetical protein
MRVSVHRSGLSHAQDREVTAISGWSLKTQSSRGDVNMSSSNALVVLDMLQDNQQQDNDDCIVGNASVAYTLNFRGVSEAQLNSYAEIMRRATGEQVVYLVEDNSLKVFLQVDNFCSFPTTRPSNMSMETARVHDQTYRECRSANEYVKMIYEGIMELIKLERRLKEVLYVQ